MSAGLRKVKRDRFVTVPNETARDEHLSFRARGVLLYLLSHEDGWDVRSEAIARAGKEGREAIRTALRELGEHGYYRLERRRGRDGRSYMGTAVSDYPIADWISDYAEFDGTAVPVIEQRDGSFLVRHKDGSTSEDATSRLFDLEPGSAGDGFPGPGDPEAGSTGDRFSGAGAPGAGQPDSGAPDPGSPGPFRKTITENNQGDPPGHMVNGSAADQAGRPEQMAALLDLNPGRKRVTARVDDIDRLFDEFWQVWPRRVKRADAAALFAQILTGKHKPQGRGLTKPYEPSDPHAVIEGARRFAVDCLGTPADKIPHPTTWLNARRWEDEAYSDTQARVGAPQQQGHDGRPSGFYIEDVEDSSSWFEDPPQEQAPSKHVRAGAR